MEDRFHFAYPTTRCGRSRRAKLFVNILYQGGRTDISDCAVMHAYVQPVVVFSDVALLRCPAHSKSINFVNLAEERSSALEVLAGVLWRLFPSPGFGCLIRVLRRNFHRPSETGSYMSDRHDISPQRNSTADSPAKDRMSHVEQSDHDEIHRFFMRKALDEARKCIHVPTAFCVGCIIVVPADESRVDTDATSALILPPHSRGTVLATGYSRELPGNTHAEANALHKAREYTSPWSTTPTTSLPSSIGTEIALPVTEQTISKLLAHSWIYTTLEPCSIRTSGLAPCANAILDAKIKKCYIGAPEPLDFVTCEGAKILRDAGVEVVWVKGLEEECLNVARGDF